MKHIPILFSADMILSKLAGRKTQTRRVINPQPIIDNDSGYAFDGNYKKAYDMYNWKNDFIDDFSKWMPGDVLWTRESFKIIGWDWEDNEMHVEYCNGDVVYMEVPEDQSWLGNYIDRLTHLGILKLGQLYTSWAEMFKKNKTVMKNGFIWNISALIFNHFRVIWIYTSKLIPRLGVGFCNCPYYWERKIRFRSLFFCKRH